MVGSGQPLLRLVDPDDGTEWIVHPASGLVVSRATASGAAVMPWPGPTVDGVVQEADWPDVKAACEQGALTGEQLDRIKRRVR